jgi:hypothetical protein
MDLFLWSHIKAPIYTSPVDSEKDHIGRVAEAAAANRKQPGIFERTWSVSAALLPVVCRGRWPYV